MSKGEGRYIGIKFTEELIGDVSGLDVSTTYIETLLNKGTILASNTQGTQVPNYCVDGSTSTRWETRATLPQWIQIYIGKPVAITKMRLYSGSSYRPNAFELLGSNNGNNFDVVYEGACTNSTGWKEFTFENDIKYSFYRWNILSGHTAGRIYIYELELYYNRQIGNDGAFKLSWHEKLYINGPLINKEYVPISVIAHPTEPKSILIEADQYERFHNAEGVISIEYDMNKGNLKGLGGFVESFSTHFSPADLVQKLNPNAIEYFEITPDVTVAFIKVEHIHGHALEHFEITPSVNLNFEYVGVINP